MDIKTRGEDAVRKTPFAHYGGLAWTFLVALFHQLDEYISRFSSARNFGLDNAHGRYITFCDADDYYEEGAISFLMSELV